MRCFANAAAHLAEGGVFLIEAFVPDLARFDRNQRFQTNSVSPTEVNLDASRHDPLEQRVDSVHVVLTEAGTRLYPVNLRYAFPGELDLMARLAGLELSERWGGWQREQFTGREPAPRLGVRPVNGPVRVACVQAEPVILDREATLDKLAALTAEAKANGAQLVVFPETFIPAYPSSAWAKFLAGWADPRAKGAFAQLARESVEVPGPGRRPPRGDRAANTRSGSSPASTSATRPGRARSTTRSSTTRRTAASRSTTGSSCRRTTSG